MLTAMTLISAVCLTNPQTSTTERECFVPGAIGTAPDNPPLETELPPSKQTPDGILLAPERAAEVTWRMRCYQMWPFACQAALDAQDEAHDVEIVELERVAQRIVAMRLERPEPAGWPPWLVALVSGGSGAAVGLAAGLILGVVL